MHDTWHQSNLGAPDIGKMLIGPLSIALENEV